MSEASRELDIQVAEAMGWHQWDGMHDWDGPDDVTFFFADKQWDRLQVYEPGSDDINRFVSFSTRIASAFEFVDYMSKQGVWIDALRNDLENHWRCGVQWRGEHGLEYRQEWGETAPLAISRALLSAAMARAPQGDTKP